MQVAPAVSVIIPAHDAAVFLPAALRSVRRQTLADIEIIVVDDGSTDGTWPLLLEAARDNARIRPLRHATPRGVSSARNAGIEAARGRFLAFLDADDLFRPRRLERLVAFAEATGADLAADDLRRHWHESCRPIDRHLGAGFIAALPQPLTLAALIAHDMPGQPDAAPRQLGYLKPVFRRAFLRRHGLRFAPGLHAGEDMLLYAECIAAGGAMRIAPFAEYRYAVRLGSLSNRPGIARDQAEANRRMAAAAARRGDAAALALLAARQRVLDHAAVADAALEGAWLDALAHAQWRRPAALAADLRVVAGAARRLIAPGA